MSSKFAALLVILAYACSVIGSPLDPRTASTCGTSILTSARTETITVVYEDIITVAHSCYSYTVTAPQTTGCSSLACGPIPECIVDIIATVYIPPADSCCALTPTVTAQGPCRTCQVGCATDTIATVTITTTGSPTTHTLSATPVPLQSSIPAALDKRDSCTTTLFVSDGWQLGPTRTLYAWTTSTTAYTDCGGCDYIVESNVAPLGPGVLFTATYDDASPTTTTSFLCLPS